MYQLDEKTLFLTETIWYNHIKPRPPAYLQQHRWLVQGLSRLLPQKEVVSRLWNCKFVMYKI